MIADGASRTLRASLERIVAAGTRQRAAAARALGLLDSDVLALQHLVRARELSPGALAARMPLSPAGTAAVIDRLQRAGLLTRERHPRDGRRAVLRPTAAASARLDEVLHPLSADLDAWASGLPASEQACAERVLAQLAELGERHAERLARTAQDAARAAEALPSPVVWG